MPDFVAPQLCETSARPPAATAGCTRSSSTAIACSCASRTARRRCKTRKGLDWTDKFPRDRQGRREACPTPSSTARSSRSTSNGAPDFAALQAALSDGKTDDLIFFAFDLLFAERRGLRPLPLLERKERLASVAGTALRRQAPRIRYVEHFETAGDAVLQSACRMDLEGIVSKRLDAPYRSGRGESWTKSQMPRRP